MEARASFSGASVSRTFVAAILIIIALGLAAMGGYATKALTGAAATSHGQVVVHAAPGTVLRQDNPKGAATSVPADRPTRGGHGELP